MTAITHNLTKNQHTLHSQASPIFVVVVVVVVLQFAFSIIHGSGRVVKNGGGLGTRLHLW